MAPSIVGNDSVAVVCQEEHLGFPIVAVEGPAMGEGYNLAGGVTPIFVEDLGGVFGCYERHFGYCGFDILR